MLYFARPNRRNKKDRAQDTQKQGEIIGPRLVRQKCAVITG